MKLANLSISTNEEINLISNMATMLRAGIPIIEVIDSLLEDSKGQLKIVLETLRADLMQGKRIYTSFSRFPKIFDNVTINLIRASEEAGTLDVSLEDLKINIQKQMEFNDQIRGAMIYPVFILFVFFSVMIVILIVVIPKISTVFSSLGTTLPLPTQMMIVASNFLIKNTIEAISFAILISAFILYMIRKHKKFLIRMLLSLPYISKLGKDIDIARFTRSLYLLLNSGLPIGSALALAGSVVNKKEVAEAIEHSRQVVLAGKSLSEGFKAYKNIFPSMIIKITEAGEKSGSLDTSMQDASVYLDYQVAQTLKTVTALIEPVMLVVVGILIGGMMLAIIAPMYGMISQISNPH